MSLSRRFGTIVSINIDSSDEDSDEDDPFLQKLLGNKKSSLFSSPTNTSFYLMQDSVRDSEASGDEIDPEWNLEFEEILKQTKTAGAGNPSRKSAVRVPNTTTLPLKSLKAAIDRYDKYSSNSKTGEVQTNDVDLGCAKSNGKENVITSEKTEHRLKEDHGDAGKPTVSSSKNKEHPISNQDEIAVNTCSKILNENDSANIQVGITESKLESILTSKFERNPQTFSERSSSASTESTQSVADTNVDSNIEMHIECLESEYSNISIDSKNKQKKELYAKENDVDVDDKMTSMCIGANQDRKMSTVLKETLRVSESENEHFVEQLSSDCKLTSHSPDSDKEILSEQCLAKVGTEISDSKNVLPKTKDVSNATLNKSKVNAKKESKTDTHKEEKESSLIKTSLQTSKTNANKEHSCQTASSTSEKSNKNNSVNLGGSLKDKHGSSKDKKAKVGTGISDSKNILPKTKDVGNATLNENKVKAKKESKTDTHKEEKESSLNKTSLQTSKTNAKKEHSCPTASSTSEKSNKNKSVNLSGILKDKHGSSKDKKAKVGTDLGDSKNILPKTKDVSNATLNEKKVKAKKESKTDTHKEEKESSFNKTPLQTSKTNAKKEHSCQTASSTSEKSNENNSVNLSGILKDKHGSSKDKKAKVGTDISDSKNILPKTKDVSNATLNEKKVKAKIESKTDTQKEEKESSMIKTSLQTSKTNAKKEHSCPTASSTSEKSNENYSVNLSGILKDKHGSSKDKKAKVGTDISDSKNILPKTKDVSNATLIENKVNAKKESKTDTHKEEKESSLMKTSLQTSKTNANKEHSCPIASSTSEKSNKKNSVNLDEILKDKYCSPKDKKASANKGHTNFQSGSSTGMKRKTLPSSKCPIVIKSKVAKMNISSAFPLDELLPKRKNQSSCKPTVSESAEPPRKVTVLKSPERARKVTFSKSLEPPRKPTFSESPEPPRKANVSELPEPPREVKGPEVPEVNVPVVPDPPRKVCITEQSGVRCQPQIHVNPNFLPNYTPYQTYRFPATLYGGQSVQTQQQPVHSDFYPYCPMGIVPSYPSNMATPNRFGLQQLYPAAVAQRQPVISQSPYRPQFVLPVAVQSQFSLGKAAQVPMNVAPNYPVIVDPPPPSDRKQHTQNVPSCPNATPVAEEKPLAHDINDIMSLIEHGNQSALSVIQSALNRDISTNLKALANKARKDSELAKVTNRWQDKELTSIHKQHDGSVSSPTNTSSGGSKQSDVLFHKFVQQCSAMVKTEDDKDKLVSLVKLLKNESGNQLIGTGFTPPDFEGTVSNEVNVVSGLSPCSSVEPSSSKGDMLFEGRTMLKGGVKARHIPKTVVRKDGRKVPKDPRCGRKLKFSKYLPLPKFALALYKEGKLSRTSSHHQRDKGIKRSYEEPGKESNIGMQNKCDSQKLKQMQSSAIIEKTHEQNSVTQMQSQNEKTHPSTKMKDNFVSIETKRDGADSALCTGSSEDANCERNKIAFKISTLKDRKIPIEKKKEKDVKESVADVNFGVGEQNSIPVLISSSHDETFISDQQQNSGRCQVLHKINLWTSPSFANTESNQLKESKPCIGIVKPMPFETSKEQSKNTSPQDVNRSVINMDLDSDMEEGQLCSSPSGSDIDSNNGNIGKVISGMKTFLKELSKKNTHLIKAKSKETLNSSLSEVEDGQLLDTPVTKKKSNENICKVNRTGMETFLKEHSKPYSHLGKATCKQTLNSSLSEVEDGQLLDTPVTKLKRDDYKVREMLEEPREKPRQSRKRSRSCSSSDSLRSYKSHQSENKDPRRRHKSSHNSIYHDQRDRSYDKKRHDDRESYRSHERHESSHDRKRCRMSQDEDKHDTERRCQSPIREHNYEGMERRRNRSRTAPELILGKQKSSKEFHTVSGKVDNRAHTPETISGSVKDFKRLPIGYERDSKQARYRSCDYDTTVPKQNFVAGKRVADHDLDDEAMAKEYREIFRSVNPISHDKTGAIKMKESHSVPRKFMDVADKTEKPMYIVSQNKKKSAAEDFEAMQDKQFLENYRKQLLRKPSEMKQQSSYLKKAQSRDDDDANQRNIMSYADEFGQTNQELEEV